MPAAGPATDAPMETLPQQGLLLIDKPRGVTSSRAVVRVRKRFGGARAGHCGTLDPAAEGLLVVGLGQATRVLPYLTSQLKRYDACVRLGVRTATADCEGEVLERSAYRVPSARQLRDLFNDFTGEVMQTAPAYSALKHRGRRLYQWARAGSPAPGRRRLVRIYSLQLLHIQPDGFCFSVECSQGTYVRTLAEDMGARLGAAAYLGRLRRTAIGPFSVTRALPLGALDDSGDEALARRVLAMDEGLAGLPAVFLECEQARRFCLGQPVPGDGPADGPAAGEFRVYGEMRRFIGIAAGGGGQLRPKRVFCGGD